MRIGRREWLLGASALGLIGARGAGRRSRWPAVPPPVTRRVDHWIEQLGRRRNDPYSWLRFVSADGPRTDTNLPPTLASHLRDEAAYAAAVTKPLEGDRAAFLAAMTARASRGAETPPLASVGWRYVTRMPAAALYPVHVRIDAAGREELLVDEAERARGHAYYRSTEFKPSPDYRYFAWAEDVIGNDRHRICVLDTSTGQVRIVAPADAYGYDGLTFSPSSTSLFWIWRDSRNRPTRLYRSPVTGGAAKLVYEERDPAIFMAVKRTAGGQFVALRLSGPDTAEVRLISADAEREPPRVVTARVKGVTYDIDEWDGAITLLTDADGAFDRMLLLLDPVSLAPRRTLVEHVPGRPILTVVPFKRALAVVERVCGLQQLSIIRRDGAPTKVSFNDPAYAIEVPAGQDYDADRLRIVHQTPASPSRWIDVDLATGAQTVVAQERLPGFDSSRYIVERLEAPASDGTMVPMTVLSLRTAARDGRAPLLLYGYGAYGISSDPVFSLPATVLVDRGWRYAIAHVRGGSEKGQRWFLGGRRFTKRNSMTDFIACAQALTQMGYAARDRIVSYGLSAGGLLVGGALDISPATWAGVVAEVPFVDMLNTMSDATHPLVPLFRPDWGDPLADPEAYDYIASISPYENVRRAPYPPVLATAGLKDDRVSYWEPAKFVAAIRERSTSGNPAILEIDMAAGHQTSADLHTVFSKMALFWAFAVHCAN